LAEVGIESYREADAGFLVCLCRGLQVELIDADRPTLLILHVECGGREDEVVNLFSGATVLIDQGDGVLGQRDWRWAKTLHLRHIRRVAGQLIWLRQLGVIRAGIVSRGGRGIAVVRVAEVVGADPAIRGGQQVRIPCVVRRDVGPAMATMVGIG